MAIRPGLLSRLERRLEEQEIAVAVEKARRINEYHGLPFGEADRADVVAFHRYRKTWSAGVAAEEAFRLTIDWWCARLDLAPAEVTAEAEQVLEEHAQKGCGEVCFLHE